MFRTNLSRVINPIIFVFNIIGLWPKEQGKTHLYKLYGIIMFILFSLLVTISMIIELFLFTEMENLTDNMYMALTEFALLIKIINFYSRLDSMQHQLRIVQNFRLESVDEVKQFDRRLNFIFWILMLDFISTGLAVTNAMIKSLLSKSGEWLLLFPAWYPIDWRNDRKSFWMSFGHQYLALILTSNLNVAIEMYPNFLLFMISAEMEILGGRLNVLGYEKRLNDDCVIVTNSAKQNEILKQLKSYIKIHQEILM